MPLHELMAVVPGPSSQSGFAQVLTCPTGIELVTLHLAIHTGGANVSTPIDAKQRAADTYNAASTTIQSIPFGRGMVVAPSRACASMREGASLMCVAAVALLRSRRQKRLGLAGLFLESTSQIIY